METNKTLATKHNLNKKMYHLQLPKAFQFIAIVRQCYVQRI